MFWFSLREARQIGEHRNFKKFQLPCPQHLGLGRFHKFQYPEYSGTVSTSNSAKDSQGSGVLCTVSLLLLTAGEGGKVLEGCW